MSLHYKRFGQPMVNFLDDLAAELGTADDKDHAYHVLRTFFHVLRKRLTINESFELIEMLPVFLRAVYVDGWHVRENGEPLRDLDDFEGEMLTEYGIAASRDFLPRDRIIIAVKDLFRTLARYLEPYERMEIYNELPDAVRPLWEETTMV